MRKSAIVALLALALLGCEEDSTKPYLEFSGGGFIFNYRNADAFYGFVATPLRSLPEGSVIEVQFEVPGSATPYVLNEKSVPGMMQYSFKTEQLSGIEKGHPYKVIMRLLSGPGGNELARYEKNFHTDVEQASLPAKPLVVGPGYAPNPE
jgi:hypothetical protein